MQKIFLLSLFNFYFAAACYGMNISYSLPANNSFSSILKSELTIYKRNQEPSLMMTDYGLRIQSPLVSIAKRNLQSEATIDLGSIGPEVNDLYIQTVGSSIFYNARSNYLMRLPVKEGQNGLTIPLSSLQFPSDVDELAEVRYDLFIADDSIYPLTERDIRKSKEKDFESYLYQYTRQDNSFGQNEVPQKGLKKLKIRGKDTGLNSGYIFSACVIFRDQISLDEQEEVGECKVYSLAEQSSLLPVIPGQKIRAETSFLYLIERHQQLKASNAIERSWTKLSIPPDSFVSLEKSTWRPLDR